jgi:hypothetical protein
MMVILAASLVGALLIWLYFLGSREENPSCKQSSEALPLTLIEAVYSSPPSFRADDGHKITLGNILANRLFIPLSITYDGKDSDVLLLKIIGEEEKDGEECLCAYINTYCLSKNDPRTFRVDRISRLIALETGEYFDDPELFLTRVVFEATGKKLRKDVFKDSFFQQEPIKIRIEYEDNNGLLSYTVEVSEISTAYQRLSIRGKAQREVTDSKRKWSGNKSFYVKDIKKIIDLKTNEEILSADNYFKSIIESQAKNEFYSSLNIEGLKGYNENLIKYLTVK